jgi:hypothetical protein
MLVSPKLTIDWLQVAFECHVCGGLYPLEAIPPLLFLKRSWDSSVASGVTYYDLLRLQRGVGLAILSEASFFR